MTQPPRKKQKLVVSLSFQRPVGVRHAAQLLDGVLHTYVAGDVPIRHIQVSSYHKVLAAEKIRMQFSEEDCLDIVDRLSEGGVSAENVATAVTSLYREKRWSAMELALWLEEFQTYDIRTGEDPVRFVLDMQEKLKDALLEAHE